MNPFLMNLDELVQWYKPKNEVESYIIDLIRTKESSKYSNAVTTIKQLEDDINELDDRNIALEYDIEYLERENNILKKKLEIYKKIEEYVYSMQKLFDENP